MGGNLSLYCSLKTNPQNYFKSKADPIFRNRKHLANNLIQAFCLLLERFWDHLDGVAIIEQGGCFWSDVVVMQLKRRNRDFWQTRPLVYQWILHLRCIWDACRTCSTQNGNWIYSPQNVFFFCIHTSSPGNVYWTLEWPSTLWCFPQRPLCTLKIVNS